MALHRTGRNIIAQVLLGDSVTPLVATAEYIGIDNRTVESIGLPKTAHPVDGGLPHDAEVIVGA